MKKISSSLSLWVFLIVTGALTYTGFALVEARVDLWVKSPLASWAILIASWICAPLFGLILGAVMFTRELLKGEPGLSPSERTRKIWTRILINVACTIVPIVILQVARVTFWHPDSNVRRLLITVLILGCTTNIPTLLIGFDIGRKTTKVAKPGVANRLAAIPAVLYLAMLVGGVIFTVASVWEVIWGQSQSTMWMEFNITPYGMTLVFTFLSGVISRRKLRQRPVAMFVAIANEVGIIACVIQVVLSSLFSMLTTDMTQAYANQFKISHLRGGNQIFLGMQEDVIIRSLSYVSSAIVQWFTAFLMTRGKPNDKTEEAEMVTDFKEALEKARVAADALYQAAQEGPLDPRVVPLSEVSAQFEHLMELDRACDKALSELVEVRARRLREVYAKVGALRSEEVKKQD